MVREVKTTVGTLITVSTLDGCMGSRGTSICLQHIIYVQNSDNPASAMHLGPEKSGLVETLGNYVKAKPPCTLHMMNDVSLIFL